MNTSTSSSSSVTIDSTISTVDTEGKPSGSHDRGSSLGGEVSADVRELALPSIPTRVVDASPKASTDETGMTTGMMGSPVGTTTETSRSAS